MDTIDHHGYQTLRAIVDPPHPIHGRHKFETVALKIAHP